LSGSRRGRGAVALACGFLALGIGLALNAAAEALPASDAPVYAIDNYPFQKAPALMRWRSVLQREAALAERTDPEDCKDGEPRLACAAKETLLLEEKLKDKAPAEQVAGVYAFFNAVKWEEHPANCGIDCWKSRLQFLAEREGDCGDHALAEYFTLKRLGFKERDLQLIVAQLPGFEDSFKGGHVVLRVRAEDAYFILDNRRNEVADLSGLRRYKVLAGMNADSVQIYNLVTPAPPPGFVADATQVAALITSPGVTLPEPQDVMVADATPSGPTPEPEPVVAQAEAEPAVVQSAPATPEPKPVLVAAVATAPDPEVVAKGDEDSMCLQSAQLADWNPFLPCTPTKSFKMVVKAKTIIGAEPPKSLDDKPAAAKPAAAKPDKPVEVAEAPKAPEPKAAAPKAPAPKALEAKPATKPAAIAPALTPKDAAEAEDDDAGGCTQGATLGDWNPDLPCGSSGLRIAIN